MGRAECVMISKKNGGGLSCSLVDVQLFIFATHHALAFVRTNFLSCGESLNVRANAKWAAHFLYCTGYFCWGLFWG